MLSTAIDIRTNLVANGTNIASFGPLEKASKVKVVLAFCDNFWMYRIILYIRDTKLNMNCEFDLKLQKNWWCKWKRMILKEYQLIKMPFQFTFKTNGTVILIFFGHRSCHTIALRLGMFQFAWRATFLGLTIKFPNTFHCRCSFQTTFTYSFFSRVRIFLVWICQNHIVWERYGRGSVSAGYWKIKVQMIMSCIQKHGGWATINFGCHALLHSDGALQKGTTDLSFGKENRKV